MLGATLVTANGGSNAEPAEDPAWDAASRSAAGLQRIVHPYAVPSWTPRVSAPSAFEPGEERTLDLSSSPRLSPRLRVSASKWNLTNGLRLGAEPQRNRASFTRIPRWHRVSPLPPRSNPGKRELLISPPLRVFLRVSASPRRNGTRSEERRVGKECRSRWSPYPSSRRRHTRCLSDWSSDVCSSDLNPGKRELLISPPLRVFLRVSASPRRNGT